MKAKLIAATLSGALLVGSGPASAKSPKEEMALLSADLRFFAISMGKLAGLSKRCGIENRHTLLAEVEQVWKLAGVKREMMGQAKVNFDVEFDLAYWPEAECERQALIEKQDRTNALRIRLLDAIGNLHR